MSMAAETTSGIDGDHATRALIEQAAALVTERRRDLPPSFVVDLFGRTAAEDLVRYQADDLALLAEEAFALLANRKPGEPVIRLHSPGAAAAGALKHVSVLEIVNDDMPFLVDSVMGELTDRGIDIRLVAHPVFTVKRDTAGRWMGFERPAQGALRESFIHIHLHRIDEETRCNEIVAALEQVLADVRLVVQDWRPMLARVREVITDLDINPPPLPADEVAEAIQFLEWLVNNNFTLLGVREYALTGKEHALDPVFETGLGIMRRPEMRMLKRGGELLEFTPEILAFLQEPKALIITKAAVRSRVHRRVHMDYVGVKRYDQDDELVGECRIIGLFTSTAYTRSARSIPYLRRKIDTVIARAGFDPEGHSGKELVNVLETYPRDELFQIDEDTLYQSALIILQLEERPRVRVLPRRERFDRFVSVRVYVPRDRHSSDVRQEIGAYLAHVYKGHVSAYYPYFAAGPLVRIHFIIGRTEGETPHPSRAELEQAVSDIVLTWTDRLKQVLAEESEPARARSLFERYGD